MPKFKVQFKHTVEQTYEVIVEAPSKKVAIALVDEEPFEYVKTEDEPIDVQGLDVKVLSAEEID